MIVVTCAIVIHDNKILVTQRGPQMQHPLKWEFPGGKIEPNETAEQCIIREIWEELRLQISIVERLSHTTYETTDFKITLIPFVAQILHGEIQLYEHQDYKWLRPEEMADLDWAAADVAVFEVFARYLSDKSK